MNNELSTKYCRFCNREVCDIYQCKHFDKVRKQLNKGQSYEPSPLVAVKIADVAKNAVLTRAGSQLEIDHEVSRIYVEIRDIVGEEVCRVAGLADQTII